MSSNPLLPRYVGSVHPNCDYHHGQILPAKGVKCWQVSRASRDPAMDDHTGFTYKHAPDLVWWRGRFYIQYLCNPQGEHSGQGVDVLASSSDGRHWEGHRISFPPYRIPACTVTDYKGNLHTFSGESFAFIHHRMCFFQSSDGRLLLLSFYGWSPKPWMTNWDNYGIGRVVRELYPNGEMSEIYFILPCWQAGWSQELLNYPLYTESPDPGFVSACEELLGNSLYIQQWAEENGDGDPRILLKHPAGGSYQAFCWYELPDGELIGLWKHSLAGRSRDGGRTWMVERVPSLVMSGQKVWGCRTSDGRYAMVYDPTLETQHRYPLCVTTSADGLTFDRMRLVHGEVPPMRYEGFCKDFGPQYVRGICPGLPQPEDGALWVAYSVNKEDIWVARIPIPAEDETGPVRDFFQEETALENWNLYCPSWARAELAEEGERRYLRLSDGEPWDYCRAERMLSPAKRLRLSFSVTPRQRDRGCLYMEVQDAQGRTAVRLIFREDGRLYARTVAELPVMEYQADQEYAFALDLDCADMRYTMEINGTLLEENGAPISWKCMSAVNCAARFVLRTGPVRRYPSLDDIPDNLPPEPLPGCESPLPPAVFDLAWTCAE